MKIYSANQWTRITSSNWRCGHCVVKRGNDTVAVNPPYLVTSPVYKGQEELLQLKIIDKKL